MLRVYVRIFCKSACILVCVCMCVCVCVCVYLTVRVWQACVKCEKKQTRNDIVEVCIICI